MDLDKNLGFVGKGQGGETNYSIGPGKPNTTKKNAFHFPPRWARRDKKKRDFEATIQCEEVSPEDTMKANGRKSQVSGREAAQNFKTNKPAMATVARTVKGSGPGKNRLWGRKGRINGKGSRV